jgi:hypothetical protein
MSLWPVLPQLALYDRVDEHSLSVRTLWPPLFQVSIKRNLLAGDGLKGVRFALRKPCFSLTVFQLKTSCGPTFLHECSCGTISRCRSLLQLCLPHIEARETYVIRSSVIYRYSVHQKLLVTKSGIGGACSTHLKVEKSSKIVVGKPKTKRELEKSRHR